MYNAKAANAMTKDATSENKILSDLIDIAILAGDFTITHTVSLDLFKSLRIAGYKLYPSEFISETHPVVIDWS